MPGTMSGAAVKKYGWPHSLSSRNHSLTGWGEKKIKSVLQPRVEVTLRKHLQSILRCGICIIHTWVSITKITK